MHQVTRLLSTIAIAALTLATSGCGRGGNSSRILSSTPLHETASYLLAPARSSTQVKSGSAKLTVVDHLVTATDDTYTVQADYALVLHTLFWDQPYSGTSRLKVPAAYFSQSFWDNLAATGAYKDADFTATYKGTEAALAGGESYADAYKVEITAPGNTPVSLKDLGVEVAVKPELPVIGAVTIDISATLNGTLPLKAGFDLSGSSTNRTN